MRLRINELRQTVKMVIAESAAEQLLNLPQNPTPQDVYSSVMDWMSMYQDPSIEPDAGLVDSVIANVMVKNQIRKDDEHIGSKLNMLRRILDPDKARRQSYRQGIESEMRELDPTGKKQKYGYQTPSSLRMEGSKIRLTKKELRKIIKEAISNGSFIVDWNELDENKWQLSRDYDSRVGQKVFGVYDYNSRAFDNNRPSWNPNPEVGHAYISKYSSDSSKKYPVFISADGKEYQVFQREGDEFMTLRSTRAQGSISSDELVEFLNRNECSYKGPELLISGDQINENKTRITKTKLKRIIRKAINESGYMSGHLQNAVRLDNLDGSSASPATSSRWYEFASLLELDTSDLNTLAFELGLAGFEELETAYSGEIDGRLAERIVDIGSEMFRSPEAAIWDALETVR